MGNSENAVRISNLNVSKINDFLKLKKKNEFRNSRYASRINMKKYTKVHQNKPAEN